MRPRQTLIDLLTVVIKRSLVFACLVIFSLFAVYTYTRVIGQDKAYAAESTNLNFQARLYDADGSLVDDGLYNVEFKLFNAVSSSGSSQGSCTGDTNCKWTETRTGGNQVRVVNGYFNVNFGSVNAFPSTIQWDQEHWLTLNVGGTGSPTWDGEMTPRIKLTAVPYAFRAAQAKRLIDEQLNGTGTLEWLTLTANRTVSLPNASGTVLLDSTGFLNNGNSFGGTATLGTNDSNDLILETGGVEGLRIDQDGDVGIGTLADAVESLEVNGGIKLGNTSNTNAGTLRWTGADFEGYNGAQWVSLTNSGGTTVIGTSSTSFVSGVGNMTGTGTTNAGLLSFTSATAVSNAAGSDTFVAPADGSFRTCALVGNADRTAGTVSVRWRVGGSSVGSAVCTIDGTKVRTSASSINSGTVNFTAGQTIGVALESSSFTPTNTDFTVYWTVDYEGGASGGGDSFVQDGNSFGTIGTLGTADGFGLNIITNNTTALSIGNDQSASFTNSLSVANGIIVDSAGLTVTAGGIDVVAGGLTVTAGGIDVTGNSTIDGTLDGLTGLTFASGNLDLGTGNITNVGANITASAGLTLATSGSGDLTLTSAGGDIILNASTLQRTASGTTVLALNDGSDTTLSLTNAGTGLANLDVEGAITATSLSGSGSGLTSLNASNISSGSLADGRLSSNVALLDGGQTFSALTTFNSGLVVGNTASATSGAIRFTGSDFEGYDGLSWVSLTATGGGGGGGNVTTVVKSSNETVNNSAALQNDDELVFPVGTSESWSFRFVVQANSSSVANLKFAVIAPTGSVCKVSYSDPEGATSDGQLGCGTATATIAGNGATDLYEITGTVTSSTTAGNVRLQWSQATAEATNSIVYAGSYLNAFPQSLYTPPASTVFTQGGNTFGATAVLGTGDSNGLNLVTNGSSRLSFLSTGEATFSNTVTMQSTLTLDGATTFNGAVTIGDNVADGLTIVSGNITANNGLNIDANTLVIDSADNQVGIGTSNPLNTLTINTPNTADANAQVSLYTNGTANKGLIIQRTSGQTANLFEVQDSSGNALSYITQSGGFVLGRSSFTNGSLVFKNSSNAFTSSFTPGALSTDRTITLPDSSGVVCLDSNNCSFTQLAPSSAQTDSSTNNSLYVNKTNATGNLLRFQRSGTNVFTVLNSGALEIQLDSTTALNVMNASGTSLFSIDTTGNTVRIGSSTADGTGVLFVLDTKNTSGDPTGINGASYYNSNSGKMRCYANNYWADCTTSRVQQDTTLGSAASSISVAITSTGTALRCTLQAPGVSAANLIYLRFNGVATGTPYGYNVLKNLTGANNNTTTESSAGVNQINLSGTSTVSADASFTVDIDNFITNNKTATWTGTRTSSATIPQRFNGSGSYFNTSAGITSVDFVTSTGNFNAGTRAWCSAR